MMDEILAASLAMDLDSAPVGGDSWLTSVLIDFVALQFARRYRGAHFLPTNFMAYEVRRAVAVNPLGYEPKDLLNRAVSLEPDAVPPVLTPFGDTAYASRPRRARVPIPVPVPVPTPVPGDAPGSPSLSAATSASSVPPLQPPVPAAAVGAAGAAVPLPPAAAARSSRGVGKADSRVPSPPPPPPSPPPPPPPPPPPVVQHRGGVAISVGIPSTQSATSAPLGVGIASLPVALTRYRLPSAGGSSGAGDQPAVLIVPTAVAAAAAAAAAAATAAASAAAPLPETAAAAAAPPPVLVDGDVTLRWAPPPPQYSPPVYLSTNKPLIFFWNIGNMHWNLVRVRTGLHKEIEVFEPMGKLTSRARVQYKSEGLSLRSVPPHLIEWLDTVCPLPTADGWKARTVSAITSAHQGNGFDCGVACLLYAEKCGLGMEKVIILLLFIAVRGCARPRPHTRTHANTLPPQEDINLTTDQREITRYRQLLAAYFANQRRERAT